MCLTELTCDLSRYRRNPDDFFLLEISMGAITGQMTNIDETGATSMFYHVYPWVMDFDPHSGDCASPSVSLRYLCCAFGPRRTDLRFDSARVDGLGYFGNALESGAYFVQHPRLGPLCFLCTVTTDNMTGVHAVIPEDAYHRRVFIQPLALYLVASAGTIAQVLVHPPSMSIPPLSSSEATSGQRAVDTRRVSLVFNATEFGVVPWSRLRLTIQKTTDANASCVAT